MEVEKKHSRGGLLHLFDWNGKSRKKLFSNNDEISGESKRGKPVGNRLRSPPYRMDEDDYNGTSSNTCCADFSSASSVTSNEGCGSRAPGLVARLMGLHLLPTPNVSELSSSTCSGSRSYRPMDHTGISNKLDWSSSSPIELRFRKVQNGMIERFHTEILPQKSVKPVAITHHKLLSHVKSPGFIPTKNAAYIMEAAAKIIEVGPRTTSEHKVPSFQSSSVPLKIRDLKEKIEVTHKVSGPQRPDEPSRNVVKSLKEQRKGKSHNTSDSGKGSSNSLRSKGKPVLLAEQARVNVRRKEGSFSSGNGGPVNPKEGNDAKGKHSSRRQADVRKNAENGTSAYRTNNVLRQNNQKQNRISNRDNSTSKTSTLDQQGRKARSVNGMVGLRSISKVTVNSESQSRNVSSPATGPSKELFMSRRKNSSIKKQPVNEDLLSGRTVSKNSSMNGGERSIKCNVTTTDGNSNLDAVRTNTSMDVVTFTSPIKISMPNVPSTSHVVETSCNFDGDPSGDNDPLVLKSLGYSSLELNIIGRDAMSVIVGEKLEELTYRVESSNCNIILEEASCSPASSQKISELPLGTLTTTSTGHHERLQVDLEKDISHSSAELNRSSIDKPELEWRTKWELSEVIEDRNASNSSSETGVEVDLQHPSALSTLELSATSEGFADSGDSTSGMMLLAPEEDVLSSSPGAKSSQIVGEADGKLLTTTSKSTYYKETTNSELDYVKMVLKDSKLKFIQYALGQTNNIVTLNAVNQLEHRNRTEGHREDHNKLELKLLLDCMSESLESQYDQVFVGSCKGWDKWGELIQNKGWLAEELYKEILDWRKMGSILVVDDLVGKNMNTKQERWLDFDMEAFEEGLEVEKTILTCLVDELVFDLLL